MLVYLKINVYSIENDMFAHKNLSVFERLLGKKLLGYTLTLLDTLAVAIRAFLRVRLLEIKLVRAFWAVVASPLSYGGILLRLTNRFTAGEIRCVAHTVETNVLAIGRHTHLVRGNATIALDTQKREIGHGRRDF
jgi:hypothetical protein